MIDTPGLARRCRRSFPAARDLSRRNRQPSLGGGPGGREGMLRLGHARDSHRSDRE